jgi:hypothetical protein
MEQHTKRLTVKPNPQSADLHTPMRSKTPFLHENPFVGEHCVDNAEHPFMPLVSLDREDADDESDDASTPFVPYDR